MIPGKPNQSKGRRSNRTLEEMLTKYNAFLRANPDWPKVAEEILLAARDIHLQGAGKGIQLVLASLTFANRKAGCVPFRP